MTACGISICCGAVDAAASSSRPSRDALEEAVSTILEDYAAAAASDPAFWEAFADFHVAVGDPEGAEEALYKRVSTTATAWHLVCIQTCKGFFCVCPHGGLFWRLHFQLQV